MRGSVHAVEFAWVKQPKHVSGFMREHTPQVERLASIVTDRPAVELAVQIEICLDDAPNPIVSPGVLHVR
jgi:hypothetical protein